MASGAKKHVDKVLESKFNRQRAETPILRKNCGNDGYVFTKLRISDGAEMAAGQCQFHHVLPVTSLSDAKINVKDKQKDYIHNCMVMTEWDINKQPNMIGLPTKGPYLNADKATAKGETLANLMALDPALAEFGSLPNLPCHLNDHDIYTQEVIDELNDVLWPNIKADPKDCKDQGKDIKSLLEARSKARKKFLIKKGKSYGGAAKCWINRETTKRSVWFIPMSMADDHRECEPPPNYNKRGRGVKAKKWLTDVFSWSG